MGRFPIKDEQARRICTKLPPSGSPVVEQHNTGIQISTPQMLLENICRRRHLHKQVWTLTLATKKQSGSVLPEPYPCWVRVWLLARAMQ